MKDEYPENQKTLCPTGKRCRCLSTTNLWHRAHRLPAKRPSEEGRRGRLIRRMPMMC